MKLGKLSKKILITSVILSLSLIHIFYKIDPLRVRKLLLHKHEIRKLIGATTIKGYSLVPMRMYLKNGRVKLELGLAKGKKLYDKRQDLAKKDAQRRIEREMTGKY